ncbi:hypothetical protein ACFYUV_00680 [Nonomuraea sp. NPDC003560]|uniref:hypothetical protein n=1 Tax=Nonomuraea sp. NPDC003560 TaxID=3364341 RepID=UPI00368497A7
MLPLAMLALAMLALAMLALALLGAIAAAGPSSTDDRVLVTALQSWRLPAVLILTSTCTITDVVRWSG